MLVWDSDFQYCKCLPDENEAVVLRTLLEAFINRPWCLHKPCDGSAMLAPKINNPRWADYRQQQAYAVIRVIRTSDGEIRRMEMSERLSETHPPCRLSRKAK